MQRRRKPARPLEEALPKKIRNSPKPHWQRVVKDVRRRAAPILPKRERQLNRLREIAEIEERGGTGRAMHCFGGIAFGKDERELVAMGLCRNHRTKPHFSWSKGGSGGYRLSVLVLTEKGRKALEKGKIT